MWRLQSYVAFFASLKERRLPQFVAAYAAGGWIVLQIVDQLVDRGVAPDPVYPTALALVLCGAPAAIILSWFHGAPGSQRFRPLEITLLSFLAVLAVGLSGWVWRATSVAGPAAALGPIELPPNEDPRRIAVLYLEGRGDEDVQFLAAGITETLIDELSAVEALHVISRNGVAPFRDEPVPADSVGRALEVGTVVEGRVTASSERVRVNVSLVNATTGNQYGDIELERPRAELFDLQDELAEEVALRLREKVGVEVQLIETRATVRDVEAWELVQRGDEAEREAAQLAEAGDPEGADDRLAAADSLYTLAEQAAPEWVMPSTRRGWLAYGRSRSRGFDRSEIDDWITLGLEHAGRAIQKSPEDPDALELRATLHYWRYLLNLAGGPDESERLLQQAEADFRASVTRNPRQASAWTSLSHLLFNTGRTAEGKLAALRSYEADAYLQNANVTLWRLFLGSLDLQDDVESRRWCAEGFRRFPEDPRFTQCQLMVNALPGSSPDIEESWRLLDQWVEVSPADRKEFNRSLGMIYMGMALVRAGLPDSARAVLVEARPGPDADPVRLLPYYEAIARSWLGDTNEAVRLMGIHLAANPTLVESYAAGDSWWLETLYREPAFRSLLGIQ